MFRHAQTRMSLLGLCLAGLLTACAPATAAATPPAGQFETALAATVSVGSTAIAQSFLDQHATLTAGAPTATRTVLPTATIQPSATPTATPPPSPTPTVKAPVSETPSAQPTANPTRAVTAAPRPTQPAATPTSAPAAGPVASGNYPQAGVCTTSNPIMPGVHVPYGRPNPILFTICSPSVVVRATGELQINVTWQPALAPGGLGWSGDVPLPGYNGSELHLDDDLGNSYQRLSLEGAAKDGASGPLGSTLSGSFVFPAPQAGARVFTLVDGQFPFSLSGISLK